MLEEVVALIVHQDECREVLHLNLPDSFHTEFGIFHALNALDVVLCQDSGRTTDRAQVETAILLAGICHLLAAVTFGKHNHAAAVALEEVYIRVHTSAFHFENIEFREFPLAKRNWFFRMYYEYIGFNKVSKSLKPKLWLSLHDMSPIVTAERKAVYCHNSTPFYHVKLNQIRYSYKLYLFSVFYKYIYRINIKSNTYVIVQQQWLRNAFAEMYKLDKHKIIVSYPCELPQEKKLTMHFPSLSPLFFFPSLSRPFKNFEIICKAADLLIQRGITNFKVVLTINGSEDLYSKEIVGRYRRNQNIDFCGRLSYSDVCETYLKSTCLIFPSKLETWGLPRMV